MDIFFKNIFWIRSIWNQQVPVLQLEEVDEVINKMLSMKGPKVILNPNTKYLLERFKERYPTISPEKINEVNQIAQKRKN
jgi:hypothetical protein